MIRLTLFEFDYSALHREIISRNNLYRSCCDTWKVIHRNDWFTSTMITTTNILATGRLASTSLLYLFSASGEWVNRESHRHATGLYWWVTKFQPSTISCRATLSLHTMSGVSFFFTRRGPQIYCGYFILLKLAFYLYYRPLEPGLPVDITSVQQVLCILAPRLTSW